MPVLGLTPTRSCCRGALIVFTLDVVAEAAGAEGDGIKAMALRWGQEGASPVRADSTKGPLLGARPSGLVRSIHRTPGVARISLSAGESGRQQRHRQVVPCGKLVKKVLNVMAQRMSGGKRFRLSASKGNGSRRSGLKII